jgi:hypothetical protein
MWKEATVSYLKRCPETFLKVLNKTTQIISWGSRFCYLMSQIELTQELHLNSTYRRGYG